MAVVDVGPIEFNDTAQLPHNSRASRLNPQNIEDLHAAVGICSLEVDTINAVLRLTPSVSSTHSLSFSTRILPSSVIVTASCCVRNTRLIPLTPRRLTELSIVFSNCRRKTSSLLNILGKRGISRNLWFQIHCQRWGLDIRRNIDDFF
jgi:hypothetical protein